MAPNCDVKRTSLIKSAAACVCVCVCVLVSVLIRAVLCIEALTSCSSELMYSTDAVFWNETIAPDRCACFLPPELFCFCQ